ncbi:magnesium chelatase subunit D [Elioraea rosea]|uniref:magnesium chelatase subunit D n=1 Tax=Elioraea rosea TaxID=2492390 RepID=UPI001181DEEF|nr:magnesium chelatase subunit D [Elioraea rosea]
MSEAARAWDDALLAAQLLAIDPAGLKGLVLRARPGPVLDRWLGFLRRVLPEGMPLRKLPPGIGDSRLLGGIDLAATLKSGRPVGARGLLAEADGGLVLVPMAERLAPGLAARLGAALDRGEVVAEREGMTIRAPARVGLVLLDEGATEDEAPPPELAERIGLAARLEGIPLADTAMAETGRDAILRARTALAKVSVDARTLEALCATAAAFGIGSLRAPLLALAAARASAALAGRPAVEEADAIAATRLVLAPRATCMPSPPEPETPPEQDTPPPPEQTENRSEEGETSDALSDVLLAAAAAAVPKDLLAALAQRGLSRGAASTGKEGAARLSALRGAPLAARPGMPGGGKRLALLETLRAAAPWQGMRRRQGGPRIAVRREDFHIRRYRERSETTTIFAVDASGSSALNRMAEAKGAVELLLADCYVRRDRVALIAFRGRQAELLLPPTTSLVRAKRSLAALPGGGGTPVASALDGARALAEAVLRRGGTPVVVLFTDGRANVARDGTGGREAAERDALAAARVLASLRIASVLLDTSPRPQKQGETLAAAMGARYLPLPYADAAAVSRAVKAMAPAHTARAA